MSDPGERNFLGKSTPTSLQTKIRSSYPKIVKENHLALLLIRFEIGVRKSNKNCSKLGGYIGPVIIISHFK